MYKKDQKVSMIPCQKSRITCHPLHVEIPSLNSRLFSFVFKTFTVGSYKLNLQEAFLTSIFQFSNYDMICNVSMVINL